MSTDDAAALLDLLDLVTDRLRRGEEVDIRGLTRDRADLADALEEHVRLAGVTELPSFPAFAPPHAAEVATRRASSWERFMARCSAEPLPPVSAWVKFVARATRALDDVVTISVIRGSRPVYHRAPASGLFKGEAATSPEPLPGSALVLELEPFLAGDRLLLTCVMPIQGALLVLIRDGCGVSRVYPRQATETGVKPAGSRLRLEGQLRGVDGEEQELLLAVLPGGLPVECLELSGEGLLERLSTAPDVAIRRYGLRVRAA